MTTPTNAVTVGTAGQTRTELLGLASTFAALAHRRRDDPDERAVASFLSRLSNELESAYDAAVQADDAIIDAMEASLDDPVGDVWAVRRLARPPAGHTRPGASARPRGRLMARLSLRHRLHVRRQVRPCESPRRRCARWTGSSGRDGLGSDPATSLIPSRPKGAHS